MTWAIPSAILIDRRNGSFSVIALHVTKSSFVNSSLPQTLLALANSATDHDLKMTAASLC